MAMIRCPECGTNISDRAKRCPYCGFESEDNTRSIATQDEYLPALSVKMAITRWDPLNAQEEDEEEMSEIELVDLAPADSKRLGRLLGSWDRLVVALPALAEAIRAMAMNETETRWVADLPAYYCKLIDEGKLVLKESEGGLLPVLFDEKGHFAKQVRLKEVASNPELLHSLRHLETQAAIAMVAAQIEHMGEMIESLSKDLQNDRLAIADSAWDKLRQAQMIPEGRARDEYVRVALSTATDAKRTLMRNFVERQRVIEGNDSGIFAIAKNVVTGNADLAEKAASDAMQDLVAIANMVQVECQGHILLNQVDAAQESLLEFAEFVEDRRLDDENTLLDLNGPLDVEVGGQKLIEQFQQIIKRTKQLHSELEAGDTADAITASVQDTDSKQIEDEKEVSADVPEEE
ncbi:zinc ribbon domain-containing protein [Bifidobacterium canis]|mgnify:CR=1 FL=1|uniref:Putative zinc-ribbon domain-containing protein n=1 Tax=Bifidobacterium canis TaxID=2610880 RepID=A0A7K1J3Q7_9BIFI|nr:zinc ribbon domain-containing protein [Bifidobacterium canis]MUH59277.1 hypothetical protein [Bifidobacterium canis]